jgi:hypothetical protein
MTDERERLRHAGDVMRNGPSEATPLPNELPFSIATSDERERLREALLDALPVEAFEYINDFAAGRERLREEYAREAAALTEAKPESPAPPRRSRRTLTDLRDEAERRGITWWDEDWTRADFEAELAKPETPA